MRLVAVSAKHFLVQFFSTTDAGPEHELDMHVFMHNLNASFVFSVG
jgi:hypothetical protein